MDTGWAEGGQEEAHVCCSTQKGNRSFQTPPRPPRTDLGSVEKEEMA